MNPESLLGFSNFERLDMERNIGCIAKNWVGGAAAMLREVGQNCRFREVRKTLKSLEVLKMYYLLLYHTENFRKSDILAGRI